MDVATYCLQKEAEFKSRCGAAPEQFKFSEEPGSDGQRGKVEAILPMADDAYLKVYESVAVCDGAIHREVYAYSLIVNGIYDHGWDRDPNHPEQEVHEHDGPDRDREPGGSVSFKQAWEEAWEVLTLRGPVLWENGEDED